MQHSKIKQFILLLGLLLPTAWCGANDTRFFDGLSHIGIKEGLLQGAPKGSTIQATIDGHTLTVVFTENLGQVAVEITTATGHVCVGDLAQQPEAGQREVGEGIGIPLAC